MPALPLDEAGKYVAAAYIVFVLMLVIYLGIMAVKVARIERELREVADLAEEKGGPDDTGAAPGGGSEESSISDSLTPHGSGGGGV